MWSSNVGRGSRVHQPGGGGCWQKYSIIGKTYRIKIFLDDVLKSSMLRNEVFFGIRTMNNHMFMSIFNYLELTK
jgi:hypothetical protein